MAKKVVSGWELFVGPFPNLWSFFLQSIVIPEFWELWWFNSFVNPFLINIYWLAQWHSAVSASSYLFRPLQYWSLVGGALSSYHSNNFSPLCVSPISIAVNWYWSDLVTILVLGGGGSLFIIGRKKTVTGLKPRFTSCCEMSKQT